MPDEVSYEAFLAQADGRSRGTESLAGFLRALQPGVPVPLPQRWANAKRTSLAQARANAQAQMQCVIRFACIDGAWWACRLIEGAPDA